MTAQNKNNPRPGANNTSFPDPTQIRKQAEQKAWAKKPPALESMTHEEIQQRFHELHVKQIEAGLQNDQLRSLLEEKDDQAALFRIVTENMLDMVALTDMEGNFTYAGKAHEKLGYEPGFLIGKNVTDFVHPEDLPYIMKEFGELVESGLPRKVEYRYRCEDGTYLCLETLGKIITDEKGIFQKIIFSSRDITERRIAEQQLRESKEEAVQKERLYRLLFEQSPLGVFHIDENGIIVSCNDHFVKIIGSSREALVGLDMKKLPDQKLVRQLRKALAGSHAFYKDTYHSVTAKKSTPVKVYFSPLIIEDGTLVGCTGIIEDITEQKRSEEALRQSETYYRAIFETSGSAMLIIEQDTIISGININFEKMFGYPKLEVEGKKSWTQLVHPDDMEWMKKYHYLRRSAPFEAPRNYELRFFTRNGDLRHGYLSVDMISGTKRSVVSIVDITDRKQAEEAVRKSEALHSKMVTNIGDVIVIIDENGINRYKSGNIEKHFGWTPEDVVGDSTWNNVHPEDLASAQKFIADIATTQDSVGTIECRYQCKDGSYKWIEITVANLLHDPDIRGFLGNYHDITERKQAEKERAKLQAQLNQAQKMESVGRLAGGVAHDFNNMLTIINGYAEMMADVLPSSDPMYESVQEIQDAGKRSAVIVRKLLAFARKQTIAPVPMNLNDSVSGMLNMLHRLIGENIDMLWKPGKSTWPVKMDHSQIDQILANLVVNSRDAISDTGKITIESQNIEFDEQYCADHTGFVPGQFVMLAVSDNGCGMDKHVLDNVFEPFFTTKEIGQGTGLGMPTVYGIAKQNNGFVNVYSEPEQGTTVKIYFPRLLEDADVSDKKQKEEALPRGCGETVLVLEDESVVMNITRIMLERLGYNVITASRPGEAMEAAKAHSGKIDLLLSDIIMPEMNGREFAEQLNDLYPDIKTLFMSGYTENVIAHHTILDDGLNFIEKPFSINSLAAKVRAVLKA